MVITHRSVGFGIGCGGWRAASLSSFVAVVLACSSGTQNGSQSGAGGQGASGPVSHAGSAGNGLVLNGGSGGAASGRTGPAGQPIDCDSGEDRDGCLCDANTPDRSCWPGAPGESGKGQCAPGKQRCSTEGRGELPTYVWGPCTGYVLPMEGCEPASNGGAPSTGGAPGSGGKPGIGGATGFGGTFTVGGAPTFGGSPSQAGSGGQGGGSESDCVCVPGSERWCDEPVVCSWGKQKCLPSHEWGPCKEVGPPAACATGNDPFYDLQCCVDHGYCCGPSVFENNPSGNLFYGDCSAQCEAKQ